MAEIDISPDENGSLLLGVISDTHGLLRPEAIAALEGVSAIVHAGDIGKPEVLEKLETIAPVLAVRGNVDRGEWASAVPERIDSQLAGHAVTLIHRRQDADAAPSPGLVIFGHSHQPLSEWDGETWWLNPGSAGPRRFKLPICLGRLTLRAGPLRASAHYERIDLVR